MQVKDKNKDRLEILNRDFWAGRGNIPGTKHMKTWVEGLIQLSFVLLKDKNQTR